MQWQRIINYKNKWTFNYFLISSKWRGDTFFILFLIWLVINYLLMQKTRN